jgi:hypothetical protein
LGGAEARGQSVTSPYRIATPSEFFSEIVDPDVDECLRKPRDLRLAFHACISLFSLRDWIVKAHSGKTWTHNQTPKGQLCSNDNLQHDLVQIQPSFLVVSNVANSAKHMLLKQDLQWTRMQGSANVIIQSIGGAIGDGPIAAAPIAGGTDLIVADLGGRLLDVVACVSDVHSLWKSLLSENKW